MLFTLVIIFYICFELPYKKFIRFWFKLSEQSNFEEKLNNIETTFSYSKDTINNNTATLVNDDEDSDGGEESEEDSENEEN